MPLIGPLEEATVDPGSDTDFSRTLKLAKQIAARRNDELSSPKCDSKSCGGAFEISQWTLRWAGTMVCLPVTESSKKTECVIGAIGRDSVSREGGEGYLIAVTGPDKRVLALWAFDTKFRAAVLYGVPPETMDAIQPGIYGVGDILRVRASRITIPAKGVVPQASAGDCELWGVLMPGGWPTQLADTIAKAGYKSGEDVGACLNRKERN
jgi:hypothetical protein